MGEKDMPVWPSRLRRSLSAAIPLVLVAVVLVVALVVPAFANAGPALDEGDNGLTNGEACPDGQVAVGVPAEQESLLIEESNSRVLHAMKDDMGAGRLLHDQDSVEEALRASEAWDEVQRELSKARLALEQKAALEERAGYLGDRIAETLAFIAAVFAISGIALAICGCIALRRYANEETSRFGDGLCG